MESAWDTVVQEPIPPLILHGFIDFGENSRSFRELMGKILEWHNAQYVVFYESFI